MSDIAQNFLSDADRQCIIDAVEQAEKKTSGEIVPMIMAESDSYPAAVFNGALVLGLLTALPTTLLLGREDLWTFLLFLFVAYVLFFVIVNNVSWLKRLFLPGRIMDYEVSEAALTEFYTNGLHRTRDLTGILIYISVFEHRVYVLADEGINSKVDEETWQELVSSISAGIKQGKQGEAICTAVRRCGEILVDHFPVREDDTNELPDLIVQGD